MDVKLSPEQVILGQSVRGALDRHRSKHPAPLPAACDTEAIVVLRDAGFLDIIPAGGTPVDAVLVIEEAASRAPGAPVASRALIAPLMTDAELPDVIGLADRVDGAIVRHAPAAQAFLVLDGETVRFVDSQSAHVELLPTRWGYPMGRVTASEGVELDHRSGGELLRAWRVGLAAEAAGLMEAATLHAAEYVSQRKQFGKPLGSLQSIQHRLARAYVASQGTKWLARRAAWDLTDEVAAAAAACYATSNLRDVMNSCQQVCGATGLTDEFGLTRYTARMAMLQTELGGAAAHARSLARARWQLSA